MCSRKRQVQLLNLQKFSLRHVFRRLINSVILLSGFPEFSIRWRGAKGHSDIGQSHEKRSEWGYQERLSLLIVRTEKKDSNLVIPQNQVSRYLAKWYVGERVKDTMGRIGPFGLWVLGRPCKR